MLETISIVALPLFGDIGVRAAVCVLDTNVLLNEVKYSLRSGRLTRLQQAARFGFVRPYASTVVRDEVEEKLRSSKFARKQLVGVDPSEAVREWRREHGPWIGFIDPSGLPLGPGAQSVRDRDDVATAQLTELLRPGATLSWDAHLAPVGAIAEDAPTIALAYLERSREGTMRVGIAVGGGMVLTMTVGALQAVLAPLRRVEPLLLAGGLIAGGMLLHPRSGRYLRQRAGAVAGAHLARMGGILGELARGYAELAERAAEAEREAARLGLRIDVPALEAARAMDYLVAELAAAPVPLRPVDLSARMIRAGYEPRGEHPERYVASLLRRHPALFERRWGHWWRLRSYGPDVVE